MHIPELQIKISKSVLATILTRIATCTSKGIRISETIQKCIDSVAKTVGSPIHFLSPVYSDAEQFRMVAEYIARDNFNMSIEHAETFFKVKERQMFDERNIVDTIDESIKCLVYHIKSEVDASETGDELIEDIQYIRGRCRYDSSSHKLSVTKADLMMQDIRDRAFRIYSKYPLLDQIRWRVDIKKSIANEFLAVVSPGTFVEFDKPTYTQIDDMFTNNKVVLVNGVGGVGKSTLALLYSKYRVSKESNNFRVKSFNMRSFEDIFQEYFDKWIELFFAEREQQERFKKHVRSLNKRDRENVNKQIISKLLDTNYKFLFIFDGFEKTNATICEFELLKMFIRNLPENINVLITSRLSKLTFQVNNVYNLTSYELPMLEREKATEFLHVNLIDLIGNKNDTDTNSKYVLEKIGGERFMPFKLYLVVTFIRQNRMKGGWQQIVEKLFENDLLNKNTSQIIFKTVYEKSDDVRRILQIINFIDYDEINKDLLTEVIEIDRKDVENNIHS